jgi:spermidine synthase
VGRVGRNVGNVYSVNTLGTILGAAAGGLVILPLLAIAGSIVAVSVINLAVGLVVCGLERKSAFVVRLHRLGTAAALGSLAAIFGLGYHSGVPGYFRERGSDAIAVPYYRETPAATLYVKEYFKQRNAWGYPTRMLVINHHPTAHNLFRDIVVHKMLAHVPLLLHEAPEKALVVGFGIGSTSYSMARHAGLRVDCVELLREEIDTAGYFARENHDIINSQERFNLIINDGRNYILATEQTYDVISVNAIDPRLSPALYTWDFFGLCRDRMKPEGVMALWLPTYGISVDSYFSIYKSFQDVFPHSFVFYSNQSHFLLAGSSEPLRIDLDRFRARAAAPEVRESLGEVCLDDPLLLLSTIILTPEGLEDMVRDSVLNTDLNPTVEFDREEVANVAMNPEFFRAVLDHHGSVVSYLDSGPDDENKAAIRKVARYSQQLRAWMEGELIFYPQAYPDGMARMMTALKMSERNLFLEALLVPYSPTVLSVPHFRRSLGPFCRVLEEVLEAKPAMAMIHHYLAAAYTRQNDLDQAIRHSEIVARLRPDDWLYHFALGGRYRKVGRVADARTCFERILDMKSGRARGLFGLAMLSADRGDTAAAEPLLREAVREEPDFSEARALLKRVRERSPREKR